MKAILSLTVAVLTAAALFAPGTAEAGKDKKKGGTLEATFKKLDTNNDGKLSPAEFSKLGHAKKDGKTAKKPGKTNKKHEALFAKLDTNKDGFLSLEEFKRLNEVKKANKKKNK